MAPRCRPTMGAPILVTLLACASTAAAANLNAMTYKGCFSSSQPLADQGSAQYQTSGYCQPICVGKNNPVLGLSNGSNCWCGDQLPAASSLVDDSKCNTPCNGYGSDDCGGTGYWSVYLTGTTNDVTNYGGSDSSSSSTTTSPPSTQAAQATPVTTATPSVITSISPDHTVLVTVSASPTSSSSSSSNNNNGGSGTSTAGIAAGVVVGVVGAAAIVAGVFFLLRRRRRQQAEDDYKRSAQVSDFMRGHGERKAPNTAYSQMSDSRLDPEIGRRNSVGSMADEQDYSRRILRVANPDSH